MAGLFFLKTWTLSKLIWEKQQDRLQGKIKILLVVKQEIHEGTDGPLSIALDFWEYETLQMSSQK